MNVKLYTRLVGLVVFTVLILALNATAQVTPDVWNRVNRGFAKCAVIGGFAGEAEWYTDDFDVQQMINRRGEMYAYITYGNGGTNTAGCGAGLFRHDTVSNRWIKVANNITDKISMFTNNTEIIASSGYPNNATYRFTTDYINFPSGWQTIISLTWDKIPNNGCRTTQAEFGAGGQITQYVGDTVFVVQYNPCGNSNQVVKYFVGGNFVVEFPTDIYVDVMGDMPWQGITQTWLRSNDPHYDFDISAPIAGLFKYFNTNKYQANYFKVPDFIWTWDPRAMPAAQYPAMMPFKTDIVGLGGNAYYTQDDGINGFEFWRSNGTSGGTSMVRDITTGQNRESKGGHKRFPKNMTPMGGNIYMAAYGPTTGYELWRSDGSSGGTNLLLDIWTGNNGSDPNSSNPSNFLVAGSTLFFTATNGSNGTELWRTDGTAGGTVMVADIATGSSSSNPSSLTLVGTTLFFSAANSSGDRELYRCASPYTTVTQVRDINAGGSSDPQQLFAHDGILFFSATDGVTGRELWKSEAPFGSINTTLVRNIWTGSGSTGNGNPKNFFSLGNRLLFQANDSTNGAELWSAVAPYNTGSTALLVNINTSATASSFPNLFTAIGDTVFFRANTNTHGFELWKSGGTSASTRRVADMNVGTGSSSPSFLTVFDNRIYFTANNGTGGRELYFTSQAPFISVTRVEIAPGTASSAPTNLSVIGSRLYFAANDGTNGFELYSLVAGGAPTLVQNVSKSGSPYGWRNISKGPDYTNLTGNSNPFDNENPGFDYYDQDTWVLVRASKSQIGLASASRPILSFDKKQMYITTQTGAYRWIGSGWEWILSIREGFGIYPTSSGLYLTSRSGIRRINGAVTQSIGNRDFYPTCVHSSISDLTSPNDGVTLYCTKFDMRNPAHCGWSSGTGALMGIYRLTLDPDKTGSTRNLTVSAAGYIGGNQADQPVGVAWGGRPANVANRKTDLFVAGNFGTTDPGLKGRRPATDITFNSGGYSTTTSAKALVYRYNAATDTLKEIIYLGTNATDVVYDFEYINQKPAAGIGRRMAITGTFGVVVLDSLGRLLWRIDNASLPGISSGKTLVDIDRNGHVVVMRSNAVSYSHPFRIFDENGTPITGVTNAFREFAHDVAIQNDTVVVTGFRNGCLPGTRPYCGGAGGNPGQSCGGAEVQTAYLYYYKKGATATAAMDIYGKTYDYPDGAQGRDIADTRGYLVNFGADGKLYFAGESAGSETIYRWPGIEDCTAELNSVRLGICDGTVNVINGSVSTAGLRAVSTGSDLSNTASAHLTFYGRINYQKVSPGGYCEVEKGEFIIPRNSDGKSNTFRISGNDGYITADASSAVYVIGSSAFKFAGRDAQKVNGQAIGDYNGDMTVLVTNKNFSGVRFWGAMSKAPSAAGGPGASGAGRGIAVLDTLVAYVARIDTLNMHTFAPTQSLTSMGLTKTKPDGYLAIFHSDLSKFANRDSIIETVRSGDTIIPPDFTRLKANYTVSRTSVCVVGGSNNNVTFADASTLLNPTNNANWRWKITWDFGSGAQLVSGMQTFTGTANNLLTGYTPPTVRWTTTGLKTVLLRMTGLHPTFDSVSVTETKFNYINVLPTTATANTLSGAGSTCSGGVAEYEVFFDQTTAFGITSYVWTVPTGATIMSGQGSSKVRVKFGATSGNVAVYGVMPCGNTTTTTRSVTITTPTREALILAGSMALTPGEIVLRNELISRGYNVVVREDNDFDTLDFYCRNIIVVTPTVDSAFVGDKLRRNTTPVIIMNPRLLPTMAMTPGVFGSGYGFATNQRQINVINAGPNDLLGGMTTGNQTVLSANIGKQMGWGNPNANAVKIAQVTSNATQVSYFAFAAGAVMNNSYPAPARRVFLFPGERLAIDSLNALGTTLLGRAICYATNTCNIPTITVVAPSRTSFYPFDSASFRFRTVGTFNTGNVFTIQWSDRFGDFSNSTNTITTTLSGTNPTFRLIQDPMPTLQAGTNYAIRITSSNPATFSNTITGITLFDALSGPAKIIYLTNTLSPAQALDSRDTSVVAALARTGLPVDYVRSQDLNNLRMAGAKLIVLGPLASYSSTFNTLFNTLKVINIPVLNMTNERLDANGLSYVTTTGGYGVHTQDALNIILSNTNLFAYDQDGVIPLHAQTRVATTTNYYISQGVMGSGATITSRVSGAVTDAAFSMHYETGALMANGVNAPARRAFFGLKYDSNPVFNTLSVEARIFFDRMVRYLIGQPAVEIASATVAGGGSLCTNSSVSVNLTGTTGFNDNNQFLIELSGPTGSFTDPGYPVLLASNSGNAPSNISFTVPTGLPASDKFRMRVRSSSPVRQMFVNDTTLHVMMDDRRGSTRSSNLSLNSSNGFTNDDFSSGFTSINSYTAQVYGSSYMEVTGSTSTNFLRYTPTLPRTGNYEVQVIYPNLASARSASQFRIISNSGTTTVTINQTINSNRWVSLGSYAFTAGTTGYVEILGNQTNLRVDAIRFVRNTNHPNRAPSAGDKQFTVGNIWTGLADNNWHNAANWSLCNPTATGVPDSTTLALIPGSLSNPANFPIISTGNAEVRSLTISNGDAKLWVRNGRTLRATLSIANEDTLRFMEGAGAIGSGTKATILTNNNMIFVDEAAHIKADITNQGIFRVMNYASTGLTTFNKFDNLATGSFFTLGAKRVAVTNGFTSANVFSLAEGTNFTGTYTQSAGVDTTRRFCVVNGDVNINAGTLNIHTTTTGDSTRFNGNVTSAIGSSIVWGANRNLRIRVTGVLTNNGTMSFGTGTNSDRPIHIIDANIVNNGTFSYGCSPGGNPGFTCRTFVNNGLFEAALGNTNNQHVWLGGVITNNGIMNAAGTQGRIFEFEEIVNNASLNIGKGILYGRRFINNASGVANLGGPYTSTTAASLLTNIVTIDNFGILKMGEYASTTNGLGFRLNTHSLTNRAGATLEIGRVTSTGTNTNRTVICHGNFVNDGTLTLNADLNMASKASRTQEIRGVSAVNTLTVSNLAVAADTGYTSQFDVGRRNLLYGTWTTADDAGAIGGRRYVASSSANPDSAVLHLVAPFPGNYHVEIFAQTNSGRLATGTPHRVFANGVWTNFTVDQRTQGIPWLRITTTPLAFAGTYDERVVIGGIPHAAGSFGADAVRLVYANGATWPAGGSVQLGSPMTVNTNLNLQTNKLALRTNNLTLGTSATISNANSARYVVANNSLASGRLVQTVAASEVTFPVGIDSSYSPVAITNGGNQTIGVAVVQGVQQSVSTGSYVSDNIVDRTWLVSPTAQATGATVKVSWNGPGLTPNNERPGFDRTSGSLSLLGSTTTTWNNLGQPTVSGVNPYTATRTGQTINPNNFYTLSSGALVSQDRTWNGSVSTAWATPANWTPSGVPTAYSKVIIPGSVPNNPLISSGAFTCLEVEITTGTLNISGGTLTVNSYFTRRAGGTLNHTGGTINMAGSAASSIIGASSFNNLTITNGTGVTLPNATTTVNNLTIGAAGRLNFAADSINTNLNLNGVWDNSQGGILNHAAGTISLTGSSIQDLRGVNTFRNLTVNNTGGANVSSTDTITGTLTLVSGNLILGTSDLVMKGASANVVGGSASSYVQTNTTNGGGSFMTIVGNTEKVFPVGTSTFTPVAVNNGNNKWHRVRVYNGLLDNGPTGLAQSEKAVNRTWYIEPDYTREDILMDQGSTGYSYVDVVETPTSIPTGFGLFTGEGWGGSFWKLNINNGSCLDYAQIMPPFQTTGLYEVFVYYPTGSNNGTCPYQIRHANGITTVNVPMSTTGNSWISLGTYQFNAGSDPLNGAIRVATATGGSFRHVDAFRFNFRGAVGVGTTIKLGWNSSDELANFEASRVKMGAHSGSSNGWQFQNNFAVTGSNPKQSTVTGVGIFPYFCIGGWGSNQWVGGADSNWVNANNWSIGVPGPDDDVVIPAVVNSNRGPRIRTGDVANARSLSLMGGNNGRLRISGGVLNLTGNFTNNGTFVHTDGKVILSGSAPAAISGVNVFRRLEVRNGNGITLPTSTTTVADSFIVNSGTLTMNGGFLTINGPVRLNNSNSRIVMNDGLLTVRGNVDNSNGGQIVSSTTAGAVDLAGTAAQSITGNSTFRNLTISNTSTAGVTVSGLDSLRILRDLTVNSGSRLTMGSGKLVVLNNLIGNGTMLLTGSTTEIRGTSVQTLFGTPAFGNLTINKTGGSLTVPATLTTTGQLLLTNGNITLPANANYTLGSLRLASGGVMNITGGTVTISGNLDNSGGGILNHTDGRFTFSGTTKGSVLGSLSLDDVTVNKTGATGQDSLLVPSTLNIRGNLTLTRGYLKTGMEGLLSLGNSATMSSETNTARVVGRLSQLLTVNGSPVTFAGNLVSINPGAEQLGAVDLERISGLGIPGGSYATTPEFPVSKSIDAIWRIEPAQQPANPVTMTLRWTSAIDNGNNRSLRLFAYRRPAPYTGNWIKNGTTPITISNDVATITTSEFSEWTVGDQNNPLPVELISFFGNWNAKAEQVDLAWLTQTEKDNSHFVVERSQDQKEWLAVGSVQGRGTTYALTRYSFADPSAPTGLNYYRLVQVDYNGTATKSYTIAVQVGTASTNWRMYPNPTYNNLTLEAFGVEGNDVSLSINDMLGRNVLAEQVRVNVGGQVLHRVSMQHLATGMYVVKVTDIDGNTRSSLIEKK